MIPFFRGMSTTARNVYKFPRKLVRWSLTMNSPDHSPLAPRSRFKDSVTRHRIDIHHHYFPADLRKESPNPNLHWSTPPENLPWTAEISIKMMDTMGTEFSILSFPALSSGCISPANRMASRKRNELAAQICRDHPMRFGFFATLPFLDDIQGTFSIDAHEPVTCSKQVR